MTEVRNSSETTMSSSVSKGDLPSSLAMSSILRPSKRLFSGAKASTTM